MIAKVLAFIQALKSTVVAAIVLAFVAVACVVALRLEQARHHLTNQELAAIKADRDKVLAQFEAVQGTLIKERQAKLSPGQAKFVGAIKKADPSLRIDSTTKTRVKVEDTAPGKTTTAAGAPCPSEWKDVYDRFRVEFPSGLLHRSQLFLVSGIVMTDTDGKHRFAKYEFREYNPTTGDEIPMTGAKIETDLAFVEAPKPPGPGPWHLRAVAGVATSAAAGLGVQANPWKGLTVGLLGLYSTKDKDFRAVATLGYRLFGTTIAVGPFGGISSKGGAVFGGAVTIEVTR